MASDSAIALQAAIHGNLGVLRVMATIVDLQGARDDKGRDALYLAAKKGHLKVCRFLVEESGLQVWSVSSEGRQPVHGAAAGGSVSVLNYLLDRGGDPVARDSKERTPLHDAAGKGNCEALRVLLSKGIDVDPISYCCGTPLHLAAFKDQDEALKILLDHNADANKVFQDYIPPLLAACIRRSLKCMKLLVKADADVNFKTPCGPIILIEAVNNGLTDIVEFLVKAEADPMIPDKYGEFPIIRAAMDGKPELVELLFPRTKPTLNLPDNVVGIIRSMKSSLEAKASELSNNQTEDMEMEEFVQNRCDGSFAKMFKLFCGIDVVCSKKIGLKVLCQAFRYVIDMIRHNKKSWGGQFKACHLRLTNGKFQITLKPELPATEDNVWADLNTLTTCMFGYFVLGIERCIYVRQLFDLCVKLHKGIARGMHEQGAFDRYLEFIYNHPSFGCSIERGDLVKGLGMSLKYSSTDHINVLVSCLSKVSDRPPKDAHTQEEDWRNKVIDIAVLKDVFLANVKDSQTENMEITHFRNKPDDNFIYLRHVFEHGPEKTLIKTGGHYKMYCAMCKQPIRTTYQRRLVCKEAALPESKFKWAPTNNPTGSSSNTNIFQTQPLPSPKELDLLLGHVFDGFITDSICEIKLEPFLDNNIFISTRLKVFARSIRVELSSGRKKDDRGLIQRSSLKSEYSQAKDGGLSARTEKAVKN